MLKPWDGSRAGMMAGKELYASMFQAQVMRILLTPIVGWCATSQVSKATRTAGSGETGFSMSIVYAAVPLGADAYRFSAYLASMACFKTSLTQPLRLLADNLALI